MGATAASPCWRRGTAEVSGNSCTLLVAVHHPTAVPVSGTRGLGFIHRAGGSLLLPPSLQGHARAPAQHSDSKRPTRPHWPRPCLRRGYRGGCAASSACHLQLHPLAHLAHPARSQWLLPAHQQRLAQLARYQTPGQAPQTYPLQTLDHHQPLRVSVPCSGPRAGRPLGSHHCPHPVPTQALLAALTQPPPPLLRSVQSEGSRLT